MKETEAGKCAISLAEYSMTTLGHLCGPWSVVPGVRGIRTAFGQTGGMTSEFPAIFLSLSAARGIPSCGFTFDTTGGMSYVTNHDTRPWIYLRGRLYAGI